MKVKDMNGYTDTCPCLCMCVHLCVNLRRFIKPQVEMYLHCSTIQIFHFSCQTQSLQTVLATVHVLNVCNIVFLYMTVFRQVLLLNIVHRRTCYIYVQCRLFLKTENLRLIHVCTCPRGPSHIF